MLKDIVLALDGSDEWVVQESERDGDGAGFVPMVDPHSSVVTASTERLTYRSICLMTIGLVVISVSVRE